MLSSGSREPRLYEKVAAELRSVLASGRYRVGEKMPSERDLSQHFSVSRPTVREAIIALEADGLVEVRTNSGVYVLALAPREEIPDETGVGGFDVLEARRMLEPQIAALAATQIDAKTIARLRELVKRMGKPDLTVASAADREFHLEIARATGNNALETTIASLWDARDRSMQYRRLQEKVRSAGVAPQMHEHDRIVDELEAANAIGARDAMWDHLSRVIEALLEATEVEAIEKARKKVEAQRRRFDDRRALALLLPTR